MVSPSNEDLLDYIQMRIEEGPLFAHNYIYKNGEKLQCRNAFFKLKNQVDNFLDGTSEERFITLPGLRGVGKTTLLFQLYDYLINEKGIKKDNILYFTTDNLKDYLGGRISEIINTFTSEIHDKTPVTLDENLFILIDEAQYDKDWSLAGKIFYDQSKKIFMIFTGSSALNFELNADAARRIKKEPIFPLDFSEYLILKHGISPPEGISTSIKNLIFNGEVNEAYKKEIDLTKDLLKIGRPIEKEWKDYICCGGFPYGINLEHNEIHEKTFSMLDRVIEMDVQYIKSFRTDTRSFIHRILVFLALQKPGELSEGKLANNLGISSALVKSILYVLEKTHLIFHVEPYSKSAGKQVRKAWKYYFLSPSIKVSILHQLGKYNPKSREYLGVLTENMVASYFFTSQKTTHIPYGIFYSPESEGVDFLLSDIEGEVIPVEVGVGKKNKRQIKKSIKNYNSKYGIVISDARTRITREDDLIYIPITTFSFL